MPIYFIGDIHGQFANLLTLLERIELKDCYLICVGDFGIGFRESDTTSCILMNDFFKERNIMFYSIRGNHDDPLFFKGRWRIKHSNFELLEDYTSMELNGEKFLFVGGAVSIDRLYRHEGLSYWIDEIFKLDLDKIQECDVIVTHSGPTWNGPFEKDGIQSWCDKDPTLWEECLKERTEHDILIKKSKAKRHYCGHFHQYYFVDFDDCCSRIIAEFEIVQH